MKILETVVGDLLKEAAKAHPKECCGLLLGTGNKITHIQPAKNIHPTPQTHFEIDPAALIAAHRAERDGGSKIIGFYHSHPNGPAEPSATDAAVAAHDGRVWAIISKEEVKFWRDDPTGFEPLSYDEIDA